MANDIKARFVELLSEYQVGDDTIQEYEDRIAAVKAKRLSICKEMRSLMPDNVDSFPHPDKSRREVGDRVSIVVKKNKARGTGKGEEIGYLRGLAEKEPVEVEEGGFDPFAD